MSGGDKVVAQCGDGPGQMSLDRARRDAEQLRRAGRIKVEEQAQGDNLPLPGRQPHQGRHDPGIDGAVRCPANRRHVRNQAGVRH